MNTKFCLMCSKKIQWNAVKCPYCGENQYGDNNEFLPTEESMKQARKIMNQGNVIIEPQNKDNHKRKKGFSDEEILGLGLYPKDEGYKMSLISRILGKK